MGAVGNFRRNDDDRHEYVCLQLLPSWCTVPRTQAAIARAVQRGDALLGFSHLNLCGSISGGQRRKIADTVGFRNGLNRLARIRHEA
jgi:hypothetical protein